MANEAVCIETPTRFARYTISAGAVLPFGTLMKLTGDFTVEASDSADDPFVGIVWERASTATSTHTEITLAQDGVWDLKDSSAGATRGTAVAVLGANLIGTADATDILNGAIVGYLEEEAASSEVCRVRLTKFGGSGKL